MAWVKIRHPDHRGILIDYMFDQYRVFGGLRPITKMSVAALGTPLWMLRKQIRDEVECGPDAKHLMKLVREIEVILEDNRKKEFK